MKETSFKFWKRDSMEKVREIRQILTLLRPATWTLVALFIVDMLLLAYFLGVK